MATDLPAWVYDMVMHLDRWHDEHGQLYVHAYDTAVGGHDYAKADGCGCAALDAVPDEVREKARAIRSYLTSKENPHGD